LRDLLLTHFDANTGPHANKGDLLSKLNSLNTTLCTHNDNINNNHKTVITALTDIDLRHPKFASDIADSIHLVLDKIKKNVKILLEREDKNAAIAAQRFDAIEYELKRQQSYHINLNELATKIDLLLKNQSNSSSSDESDTDTDKPPKSNNKPVDKPIDKPTEKPNDNPTDKTKPESEDEKPAEKPKPEQYPKTESPQSENPKPPHGRGKGKRV
jgi:hypothetical protein